MPYDFEEESVFSPDNNKEAHPYLKYFDSTKVWKYLIIGTIPPNMEVRNDQKYLTDYFYGNKGSLWKILGSIYADFDFASGSKEDIRAQMQAWQAQYSVGITDTLKTVTRKNIHSADDETLVLKIDDYNHGLKEYIMNNNAGIEKIIFTSSKGRNSAFETFKVIMGDDMKSIKAKLVTNLPSPSGSSNVAWFNVNSDETLGLHRDLYNYILAAKQEHLPLFTTRWETKKNNKTSTTKDKLHASPKGLVNEFKVWSYRKEMPTI